MAKKRIEKFRGFSSKKELEEALARRERRWMINTIEDNCKAWGVDYEIKSDDSVDIWGNVGRIRQMGHFDREGNLWAQFPFRFGKVSGNFDWRGGRLETLWGAPYEVTGSFIVNNNRLTSIKGAPKIVGGNFDCGNNTLTSLEGSPESVGGYYFCNDNNITDFRGIPEYSLHDDSYFICTGNPIYSIYALFATPKCVDLINEFDVIRSRDVILDRLLEVYSVLGMEEPKDFDSLKDSIPEYNLIR